MIYNVYNFTSLLLEQNRAPILMFVNILAVRTVNLCTADGCLYALYFCIVSIKSHMIRMIFFAAGSVLQGSAVPSVKQSELA